MGNAYPFIPPHGQGSSTLQAKILQLACLVMNSELPRIDSWFTMPRAGLQITWLDNLVSWSRRVNQSFREPDLRSNSLRSQ